MLSRFEVLFARLLPWLLLILGAKIAAVAIELFLPPAPRLECKSESAKPDYTYNFVSAFTLNDTQTKKSTPPPIRKEESLRGYTLTMTAVANPGMAIIVKNGKSKLLSVGETIDGFRLEEVYIERVKFTKNGRTYWLGMKKKASSSSRTPSTKKRKSAEKELVEEVRKEGDTIFVPRELLREMHDLKKIFRYISINPVYKDNKLIGFGISNVKKGSVFDKMGLQKRDIIEKIDGKPIKSESDAFTYFNRLEQLNSLSLTIKRGKESKELKYEIF